MNTKSFYTSKTFWFNVVTAIVCVATFFGYTPNQKLFETISSLLITISPFANIALRFVTKKGISIR
jgi:hypothetical protein